MEVNGDMLAHWPKIFKQMKAIEFNSDRLILPARFIEQYGEQIPFGVNLQLPNGHEINVIYEHNEQCLTGLHELVDDFRCAAGVMLVLCYRGEGNFLIYIFGNGMSEIEYREIDDIPRAPVYHQDPVGGVGWKFITFQMATIVVDGEADVPDSFVDRFRNVIPTNITIVLGNGEVFPGRFRQLTKKIFGLLPMVRRRYITVWDVLMFKYNGGAQFELTVFDRMKIEKNFEIINIDSSTDSDSDSGSISNSDSDDGDEVNGLGDGQIEEPAGSDDEPMSAVEDE